MKPRLTEQRRDSLMRDQGHGTHQREVIYSCGAMAELLLARENRRASENIFFSATSSIVPTDDNHELGTCFFVHKRIISSVKMVEYVSDNMSYIILRWPV
jgi:hypothetical protein